MEKDCAVMQCLDNDARKVVNGLDAMGKSDWLVIPKRLTAPFKAGKMRLTSPGLVILNNKERMTVRLGEDVDDKLKALIIGPRAKTSYRQVKVYSRW